MGLVVQKRVMLLFILSLILILFSNYTVGAEIYDVLNNDVVSYYDFHTDATDKVGSNDFSVIGATITTSNGGSLDEGYFYDGVDDSLQKDINLDEGSVSLWFKSTTDVDIVSALIGSGRTGSIQSQQFIGVSRLSGVCHIRGYNAEGGVALSFTSNNINCAKDTWHNLIWIDRTDSGNGRDVYYDGVHLTLTYTTGSDATLTGFLNYQASNMNLLGGYMRSNEVRGDFLGVIDEVAIFSRGLNASEIEFLSDTNPMEEHQQYPFSKKQPRFNVNQISPINNSFNNTNLNVNYNVVDTTNTNINCSFYVDDDLKQLSQNIVVNSTLSFSYSISTQGVSEYYINCTNGTMTKITPTYNYIFDNIKPLIVVNKPINKTLFYFPDFYLNLSATSSDDHLKSSNLSIVNESQDVFYINNSGELVSQSTYSWDKIINMSLWESGVYNILISSTDGLNPSFLNTTFNLSKCQEDWQPLYGSCNSSDLQLKYYIDNNNCSLFDDLPYDNGTYVACNYCSQDIIPIQYNCSWNGSDFYSETTYVDNNYFSCCSVTGFVSDCGVDYTPYNESSYALCNYYDDDFVIEYDEQALYGLSNRDKVYWKFYINKTNLTEDYDCISYIKHMNNGVVGEIIQVNPTYTKKNKGFISINDEYDDREYFRSVNGLGSVYFTKKNIVFDVRQYLFGIQCTGNGEKLNSERVVTTEYESLSKPIDLSVWVKNNLTAIILGAIILLILSLTVGYLIDEFQRG